MVDGEWLMGKGLNRNHLPLTIYHLPFLIYTLYSIIYTLLVIRVQHHWHNQQQHILILILIRWNDQTSLIRLA